MSDFFIYSSIKLPKNLPGFVKLKKYPRGKKILVISPHSDDVSVSCGGIISKLSVFNKIVPVLFFTGYRGIEGMKKEKAAEVREKEMEKESKVLGIEKPLFLKLLSYESNRNSCRKKDILKVEELFMKQNPEIIFLPKKDDLQPRHKLATEITLGALESLQRRSPAPDGAGRNPAPDGAGRRKIKNFPDLFFYENPWSLFGAFEFNAVSILSKREISKKIKAIQVHYSQLKRTAFDRLAKSLAEFRGATVAEQRIFGYGKGNKELNKFYIEAFKCENNY